MRDELENLHPTAFNKELYKKRKETSERVFADAKEKLWMRWTNYRGSGKVTVHTMLTFASMNLNKLAIWLRKGNRPLFIILKTLNSKDKKSWKLNPTLFVYSLW